MSLNPEWCRELVRDKDHVWWSIPIYRKEEWSMIINNDDIKPNWAFGPVAGKCGCCQPECNNKSIVCGECET